MKQKYPDQLFEFFKSQPEHFEERTNVTKKVIGGIFTLGFLVLIIFPGIIMEGWLVRGAAIVGVLFAAGYTYLGGTEIYSKKSGGKLTSMGGMVKFAHPERGTEPFGPDDMHIINMFNNNDWVSLTDQETADDRPMQLEINVDQEAKEIYLLLCRYITSARLEGVAEVKVIKEPEYSQVYGLFKSMKKY
ncbi:hypothetical protein [Myroides profundi]|uniref:Uncharacterized protein n=2 Tax=Myroides TaxID=76831 RepID=A0AAJ4W6Q6_MYRPR|nr:hypothetical protein [Myroides profundi]AJH15350.1 hypothetical protein MPR_2179 [Myroides profundi]SER55584.1 hypothetical protein SAMN04488089_1199 [Myroides profundi]